MLKHWSTKTLFKLFKFDFFRGSRFFKSFVEMYPITDILWSFFKIKCTVSFIPSSSESANSLYKNVAQRGNVLVQILLMLLLHLSFSRNFIVSIAFITESQSKYIISDISPYNIFFWISKQLWDGTKIKKIKGPNI